MKKMEISTLADIDATELFEGENINWRYCKEHATFVHPDKTFVHHDDDACEFILHIGIGQGNEDYAEEIIKEMEEFGCTKDFIDAYKEAREAGAMRVLFHA